MVSLKKVDFELLNVDWKNIIRININSEDEDIQEEEKLDFLFV